MLTSLLLAIRQISRNRVRAGLTVLGILIGVASLIAVATLAFGVSERISGSMTQLASNAFIVNPQKPPAGAKLTIARPLTEADGRQIARELPSVGRQAPIVTSPIAVVYGDRNKPSVATGTTLDYFEIRHMRLSRGTTWTTTEESRKEKVCVLGVAAAGALFGPTDPVGQMIRIGRFPYRVTGVLEPQSGSMGDDPNNVVIMPIGSFRARVKAVPQNQIHSLLITSSSSPDRAQKEVGSILRQRHRIRDGAPPDFRIIAPGELQQMQLVIAGALSALLLCVASVSLIVGGIGVMNIMLVSVTERTREIGIRISIGATSKDILAQFLIEAIVLSFLGGLLGLAIGALGSIGLGQLVGFPLSPSPAVALLAVGTSAAIGIFAGYIPARRAATLDPIEALRAE